uniref:Uncharacterized protein n=1 Tax=Panagrellus redivivus TaxID=6233 RepID=A0A7E4V404_PANRE
MTSRSVYEEEESSDIVAENIISVSFSCVVIDRIALPSPVFYSSMLFRRRPDLKRFLRFWLFLLRVFAS